MPEFTIALAGQRGVGKTSIFRHVKKDLEESVDPTSLEAGGRIDCCYYQVKLDGIDFKVSLYDTGGMEQYGTMTANYFHNCQAVVLVYDTDPQRIDSITALKEWLDNAYKYNRNPEMLVFSLWGNTRGTEDSQDGAIAAESFRSQWNLPRSLHFKISALSGNGIIPALHAVISAVHKKWILREDIEDETVPDQGTTSNCQVTLEDHGKQGLSDSNTVLLPQMHRESDGSKAAAKCKKC